MNLEAMQISVKSQAVGYTMKEKMQWQYLGVGGGGFNLGPRKEP